VTTKPLAATVVNITYKIQKSGVRSISVGR